VWCCSKFNNGGHINASCNELMRDLEVEGAVAGDQHALGNRGLVGPQ
jgi:hypothetical protein